MKVPQTTILESVIKYSAWPDLRDGTSGVSNGIGVFGRIIDQIWLYTSDMPTTLDEYTYGYGFDSNRMWRQDTVGTAKDEYYTYDNLNRLTDMQRGTLYGSYTGITGTPVNEQPDGDKGSRVFDKYTADQRLPTPLVGF